MQKSSLSFAEKLYRDKKLLFKELKALAQELKKAHPEIKEVFVFGSIARGDYGVNSDVDLLLVLENSDKNRYFDRIPDYLDFEFPLEVEIFPFTEEELKKIPLARTALKEGIKLA
jgi:predicted nucleotidyltransferase